MRREIYGHTIIMDSNSMRGTVGLVSERGFVRLQDLLNAWQPCPMLAASLELAVTLKNFNKQANHKQITGDLRVKITK